MPNLRYLLNTKPTNNGKKTLELYLYMLYIAGEQHFKTGLRMVEDSSVKNLVKLALQVSAKCRMYEIQNSR